MLPFVLRRLVQSVLVMLAVGFLAFAMFRYVGDPVNQVVGIDTPYEERIKIRADLGLDDPFPVQFARYMARAVRLDFGISYGFRRPVTELLGERMPATLELALAAAVLALGLGVPMGVFTALKRHSPVTKLLEGVSLIGVSLPTFLIGILLIYVFAVVLGWLPSFGRGETVRLGGWTTGFLTLSGLKALVLPAITLGLYQLTLIMRILRAGMLEALRADHVRFARARGLPERRVTLRHALPNALIPVITVVGLQLGSIIAFAVITETVFQWPGMGLLFLQAVQNVDIPIMAAYLMMIAFVFVVINLVVDLLYGAVDPRLRAGVSA